METAEVMTSIKENGSSELCESGTVLEDAMVVDEFLTSDTSKPTDTLLLSDEAVEKDELSHLDDFGSPSGDAVITEESVVTVPLNGGQDWNVENVISKDVDVSAEIHESAPCLEVVGGDDGFGDVKNDFGETEGMMLGLDEETVCDDVVLTENKEENEKEFVVEEKVSERKSKKKNEDLNPKPESSGKEGTKSKFAIQADLNINSRPKRSTPRRSVFEMLQGEIRSSGASKRSSTDTGSESDPEPGPSKRSSTKKSKLAAMERLESIEEVDGNNGEKSQEMKKGKDNQMRGKGNRESIQSPRKKSSEFSRGMELSSGEHGDIFVADDFDVVETVVGDEQNANEVEMAEGDGDDDDVELTLAKFRAEDPSHYFDEEFSDNPHVPCEDPTVEIGVDVESMEYNSRWHSYATPREMGSPSATAESHSDPQTDVQKETRAKRSRSSEMAGGEKAVTGVSKTSEVKENEKRRSGGVKDIADKDNEQGGMPWYLTHTNDDSLLSNPKALQSRIDELMAINTELKARLKEVENKTATKKFNIDFHSRKFSRAREPVGALPADRKFHFERKSGSLAEKVSSAFSSEKELRQKELVLDRREEKLRMLDVELDERTVQLKADEGKLWRTERRLKEMEKTLEYRERVLRRMETNTDKKETEAKDGDVPENTEPLNHSSASAGSELDAGKLERKEQELERMRKFLSEEREKLLPKQQRLTKWEAELRKKEEELRLREQGPRTVYVSKKDVSMRSADDDSESEDDGKPLKKLVGRPQAAYKKQQISRGKNNAVPPTKVFKMTSKPTSKTTDSIMKHVNKMKAAAASKVGPTSSTLAGKKRPADGSKPVKEYKLRKRC